MVAPEEYCKTKAAIIGDIYFSTVKNLNIKGRHETSNTSKGLEK